MTPLELAEPLSEEDVLAATIWGEARNQRLLGRVAVACVVRNRMVKRKQTAKQVCLARSQFSCWWKFGGKANYDALVYLLEELAITKDPDIAECRWIAQGILSGVCRDVTGGADHYLTTRTLSSPDRPTWSTIYACTGVVESHTFYRS